MPIAPLNDVVEYEEVDFVNPFAHQTIYRGPPTPQLEAAWEKLWYCKNKFFRVLLILQQFNAISIMVVADRAFHS